MFEILFHPVGFAIDPATNERGAVYEKDLPLNCRVDGSGWM